MTFEAVLLIAFCLALTGAVKNAAPNLPSWATPFVAIAIGIVSTFVVAETDFASKEIVNGFPLDTINGASKVVVGTLLGSGAALAAIGGKVIANIGQNAPSSDRTIGGGTGGPIVE